MNTQNPLRRRFFGRRAVAGLTLVETAAAMAVLALGVAGLSNISATSAAIHKARVQKEAAARAIEQQMATVAASPFAQIQATYSNTQASNFAVQLNGVNGAALDPIAGDNDGSPGRITISAPTNKASELLEIRVRVDWNSPHGNQALERRMRISRLGGGP